MIIDAEFMPDSPPTGSPLAGLFGSVTATLCRATQASPEGMTVSLLYQGVLADSSQIFMVRDAAQQPIGIVQLSAEAAPEMVYRGMERARMAASTLGPTLSHAVLLPLTEGEIEGRSYAVTPYCLRFSSNRWRWALERLRLRPVVFDWLHRVAVVTQTGVPEVDLDPKFRRPLEQLRAVDGASESLVASCDRALARLASGAWVPRQVLMHGDLWRGNLLLRNLGGVRKTTRRVPWSERLAVIDWAGAQTRGYAFFDLVRVAESMQVPGRSLRAEVKRQCAVLGCEPVDAIGYVLAAAGALLDDLGEFPTHRLLNLAQSSLRQVESAVEPLLSGRVAVARV